jgi:hypothetical protein
MEKKTVRSNQISKQLPKQEEVKLDKGAPSKSSGLKGWLSKKY